MQTIDIVLIIIGLFMIGVSFIISEKFSGVNEEVTFTNQLPDELLKKQAEGMYDQMRKEMNEITDQAYENADGMLSKLSNEKIMAVTDYSNQILEKIENNHQEVVFLYDMLNDKEEEIKELLKQTSQVSAPVKPVNKKKADAQNDTKHQGKELVNKMDGHIVKMKEEQKIKKQLKDAASIDCEKQNENATKNQQIIEYYQQGLSVLEISRELHVGQGEVQLVINLFEGGSHE
ncbi:hypothetical protein lbkm_1641 [Lachnospiraceae bacterium KM106-2]|nr:hypothetical protein lbkm_1641 [Lachnospiraceae bacterium KM106-2]